MIVIDSNMVESASDYNSWINAIEKAFKLKRGIDYQMPQRMHLDSGENTLLLMPCIGSEFFATKLVSVFPGNSSKGLPPISGTVVLGSSKNGETLAIIDGTSLTALRTAAVGSFGIRHLAPANATRLGVVGLGMQGLYQSLFACSQRDIKEIYIYDKDKDKKKLKIFSDRLNLEYPAIKIIQEDNTDSICSSSEVIITATNSTQPVLPDKEELLEGKTIIGIGSYKPDMREFPDALYRLIDKLYIDTIDGLKESGDLLDPLSNGWIEPGSFIPGSDMLNSLNKSNSTKVFKSVGMALFDLVAAELVYSSVLREE